jgi:hypothetical protein
MRWLVVFVDFARNTVYQDVVSLPFKNCLHFITGHCKGDVNSLRNNHLSYQQCDFDSGSLIMVS